MHIYHFYPRTQNVGDHFVQLGIESMVHGIFSDATFESLDINSRGVSRSGYGLTRRTIERANQNADFVFVGGSNLYEGNYRWPWGVHLEAGALELLRVPLVLIGIGSGSNFNAPLHQPSRRALKEIRLLNHFARFSGARDVITLEWLKCNGIDRAVLSGDPATFIFNRQYAAKNTGHILLALPPRRFWQSKRQFWKTRTEGRPMFRALAALARKLAQDGETVIVCCNDPADLPVAQSLFAGAFDVLNPASPQAYFQLLEGSRAVVTGRLHTAVVAFSLGLPFVLLNVDQRTNGFIKTFDLEPWSIVPRAAEIETDLLRTTEKLLQHDNSQSWKDFVAKRDRLHHRAISLLKQTMDLNY